MPLAIACPACQTKFALPDDQLGRTFDCPGCQVTLTVILDAGKPTVLLHGILEPPKERGPRVRSRRKERPGLIGGPPADEPPADQPLPLLPPDHSLAPPEQPALKSRRGQATPMADGDAGDIYGLKRLSEPRPRQPETPPRDGGAGFVEENSWDQSARARHKAPPSADDLSRGDKVAGLDDQQASKSMPGSSTSSSKPKFRKYRTTLGEETEVKEDKGQAKAADKSLPPNKVHAAKSAAPPAEKPHERGETVVYGRQRERGETEEPEGMPPAGLPGTGPKIERPVLFWGLAVTVTLLVVFASLIILASSTKKSPPTTIQNPALQQVAGVNPSPVPPPLPVNNYSKDTPEYWIFNFRKGDKERDESIQKLEKDFNPKAVGALIEALKDFNDQVRLGAAITLAKFGPAARKALAALLETVDDANEDVRKEVATALKLLGPITKDDLPALEAAQKSFKAGVRRNVVSVINTYALEKDAVRLLLTALKDETKETRAAAAAALGKVAPAGKDVVFADLVRALWDADAEVRAAAGESLRQFPLAVGDIPELQHALRDDTLIDARRYGVFGLEQLGPAAKETVADLIEALHDSDAVVREGAAGALGKIGPDAKPAIPALAARLQDENEKVRLRGAWALARVGEPALGVLLEGLKDAGHEEVRGLAAWALGEMTPPAKAAIAGLIEALRDPSLKVRANVATTLGKMGADAKPAIPQLAQAARETEPELRRTALRAMANIGPDLANLPLLLESFRDPDEQISSQAHAALDKLGPLGKPAVPILRNALSANRPEVLIFAADALAALGTDARPAVPKLEAALKNKSVAVRRKVTQALIRIGPEAGTMSPLLGALTDEDKEVARLAFEAVKQRGKMTAAQVDALARALSCKEADIVLWVTGALGDLGPGAGPAVAPLMGLLRNAQVKIRLSAAKALGKIGRKAESAARELAAAMRDKDADVARQAIQALGQLGPGAKPAVPDMLRATQEKNLHDEVVRALAKVGKAALPELLEALEDRRNYEIRLGAVEALEQMGVEAQDAVGSLSTLAVKDPSSVVRKHAKEALQKIQSK